MPRAEPSSRDTSFMADATPCLASRLVGCSLVVVARVGDHLVAAEGSKHGEERWDLVEGRLHDLLVPEQDLDVLDGLGVALRELSDRDRHSASSEEAVLPHLVV